MLLVLAICVFLLLTWAWWKLPWKNLWDDDGTFININDLKYLKLIAFVLSYLTLMWVFSVARAVSRNFLNIDFISGFFNLAFGFLLSAILPVIICTLVVGFILFLEDKKLRKSLERGLPIR